jgi:hypothetical protein
MIILRKLGWKTKLYLNFLQILHWSALTSCMLQEYIPLDETIIN